MADNNNNYDNNNNNNNNNAINAAPGAAVFLPAGQNFRFVSLPTGQTSSPAAALAAINSIHGQQTGAYLDDVTITLTEDQLRDLEAAVDRLHLQ